MNSTDNETISMAHVEVETLRQTWARADEEAHASFNVHCETDPNEQAFRSEVVPNAGMFTDMINREIDRINSHVVACLEVLESTLPASDIELLRCSSKCGSLVAFIHCNRNALRKLASGFDEKMRSATWERCTRVNMRMIETAPFCTSLLERTLNAQARLEESERQQHGVDCSLRRLLTEVYEASAGLSENESPSVRDPPKAHLRQLMPSMPNPGQTFYVPRLPVASRRSRRVHPPRVTDLPSVEIPSSTEYREFPNHVSGPLFIQLDRAVM